MFNDVVFKSIVTSYCDGRIGFHNLMRAIRSHEPNSSIYCTSIPILFDNYEEKVDGDKQLPRFQIEIHAQFWIVKHFASLNDQRRFHDYLFPIKRSSVSRLLAKKRRTKLERNFAYSVNWYLGSYTSWRVDMRGSVVLHRLHSQFSPSPLTYLLWDPGGFEQVKSLIASMPLFSSMTSL